MTYEYQKREERGRKLILLLEWPSTMEIKLMAIAINTIDFGGNKSYYMEISAKISNLLDSRILKKNLYDTQLYKKKIIIYMYIVYILPLDIMDQKPAS